MWTHRDKQSFFMASGSRGHSRAERTLIPKLIENQNECNVEQRLLPNAGAESCRPVFLSVQFSQTCVAMMQLNLFGWWTLLLIEWTVFLTASTGVVVVRLHNFNY